MDVRCDLLPLRTLSAADLAAWGELASVAVSPNPFAEPEFVGAAARALDETDVQILVARSGRDWLAALPVRAVRGWRRVPGWSLVTWRHRYCFLGTPLVAPSSPTDVLERWIEWSARRRGDLVLEWIDDDGPLAAPLTQALANAARATVLERFERPAISREDDDGSPGGFVISRNRRIRRYRRSLEQELGPLELREESADPAGIQRFLEMEGAGWKGQVGTSLLAAGHAGFFTEICEALAPSGRLRLISLAHGEIRVAMLCELVTRDVGYWFKITFEESYAHWSPGAQLTVAAIEGDRTPGVTRLDSCADATNTWIGRYFTGSRRLRTVAAVPATAAGLGRAVKWSAAASAIRLHARYDANGGRRGLERAMRERVAGLRRHDRSGTP